MSPGRKLNLDSNEESISLELSASVLVSCYNQEKYITECLASIISQEVNFAFELIVSDDCSTDSTALILKQFQLVHPENLTLILRDKNVGAARNYLDLHNSAKGKIVFHMDGDDVMLPGKIQRQFDEFDQDTNVAICFHRAHYFSDDGLKGSNTGPLVTGLALEKSIFLARDLANWGTIAVHSSYAYRREFRKTRFIDREFMEWFFAMDSLVPLHRGVYLNDVLVKYRCNPVGGSSYLSSLNGRAKAYRIYLNDIYHYFEKIPEFRTALYANALITLIAMSVRIKRVDRTLVRFIFKNMFYFRTALVVSCYKIRKMVAP